jgi:hypothetical protein
MGFMKPPSIPSAPPPPPTPPSLASSLSNRPRNTFGSGKGSLSGTFITGPNALGNMPGSFGQSGLKTLLGT